MMVVDGFLSVMMRTSCWTICLLLLCYYTANGFLSSRIISNVALNKPTNQSSTYQPSRLAVDGIVEPPTGMSTLEIGYQWWQVDLGSVCTVANVSIQNHISNPERRSNFSVELSETTDTDGHLRGARVCYNFTEQHVPGGLMITISCPRDTIGRYIRISKIVKTVNDPLTFCEVVVEVSRDECNMANIALNKPAIQSYTYKPFEAGLAVNGNLNSKVVSCAHTVPGDKNPWWQVDLGGLYSIKQVSVQQPLVRNAADKMRLRDFIEKYPTRTPWDQTAITNIECFVITTLPCPTDTVGRYLRISKKSAGVLTFCEVIVEVFITAFFGKYGWISAILLYFMIYTGKPVSYLDTTYQQLPAIRQGDGQSLEDK